MRLLIPCLALACVVCATADAHADTYPKNPRVDVVDYRFDLELRDADNRISGSADIEVQFAGEGDAAPLRPREPRPGDWEGDDGRAPCRSKVRARRTRTAKRGRHPLPRRFVRDERLRVRIAYAGVPAAGLQNRPEQPHGERTFFSDNWPDKARHWLPIVDHLYDKATARWWSRRRRTTRWCPTGCSSRRPICPTAERRTHWRQSVPIAPWLYALGVARFAVQHVETSTARPSRPGSTRRTATPASTTSPCRRATRWRSSPTRVGPFSYEKLANVQSNSVSGGMEAASAIFYSEGRSPATRSVRWRNVVIHEMAHQWFGNAVTEYDWDDVWLSEGFATYFTLLFIEHAYGRDAFLARARGEPPAVIAFDRKHPTTASSTTTSTTCEGHDRTDVPEGRLGAAHAAWHRRRRGVLAGIRGYYRAHQDGHATTADFRAEMERASGRDLGCSSTSGCTRGGLVRLDGTWRYRSDTRR